MKLLKYAAKETSDDIQKKYLVRNTCLGRMLGRGPWYFTTPVHDATKKLQINSTNDLCK